DDCAREWVRRYWPASEHHRAEEYERLVVAERHAPAPDGTAPARATFARTPARNQR
ncbi:MAG: hypothetical protein IT373_36855, partial [Polyangiaceae bacterium]|nr:hypothetical protein [Polyangiaceae bacterium]